MMNELRLDWSGTTPPVCVMSDYFFNDSCCELYV